MSLPERPESRSEQYLAKIAGGEGDLPARPESRIEQYLDYIAENGGLPSKEEVAEAVTDWMEENIHEDPTVVIDDSLSVEGAAADAKKTGDEITDLKSALTHTPEQATTSSNNDDLDISDKNGNVLVRFVDGHIKTKNFDSENNDAENNVDSVGVAGTQLLDIADKNGNVLVRFSDGNIQTKHFDSSTPVIGKRVTYSKKVAYSGSMTVQFEQKFKAGSKLLFHTGIEGYERGGNIASVNIKYIAVEKMGAMESVSAYGYDYPTITLERDAEYLNVELPDGLIWGSAGNIVIYVYKYDDDPACTHTVTVKQDGTGDFQTLREAVDSIKDNNLINQYIIEVYPGTYSVMDYYTQEEVEEESFQGLWVGNGITLRGIGQRDDIILSATLDDQLYDSTTRNKVSALNIIGTCTVENMTILASKIRYCIHDDSSSPGKRLHIFKDLVLHASNMTSQGAWDITYGAGVGNNKNVYFENVDFGDTCSIHGSPDWTQSPIIYLRNCKARQFSFSEQESDERMYVTLDNCKATFIRLNMRTQKAQMLRVDGAGTDCIVDCFEGCVYDLGQCHKFERSYSFSVGQAVTVGTNYNLSATTTKTGMFGIVLGKLDGYTYVQCGGYINSNTFGISGLSVGDYVTLDSNGVLTDGGTAENAIGVVINTNTLEGGAIIKMI